MVDVGGLVLGAYQRAGKWKEAMETYVQLREAGLEANDITFSSLISVCEKGGQWKQALQLFNDMKALGVQPDTVTFR